MKKRIFYILSLVFFLSSCAYSPATDTRISERQEETIVEIDFSALQNKPLFLGNPSNATKDASQKENYLLEKSSYTVSYNDTTRIPNWVSWHLEASDMGGLSRTSSFRQDTTLPNGFYRVKTGDYTNSNFSRGHMCPNGDRNGNADNQKDTFIMTNIVPQNQVNNNGPWKGLENHLQTLAEKSNKECYIISGPYGKGGTDKNSEFKETIGPNIQVPAYVWKIAIVLDLGDNDHERINTDTEVIAIHTPNRQDCNGKWYEYIVNVDYLESITGFDFFSNLSEELQAVLQAKTYEYKN